jgi:uncharacterized protein
MTPAIAAFVAVAYALSVGLSLVIGFTGGHHSRLAGLGVLSMFLPSIAVFIVRAATGEGPRIDWDRLPLKYLPLALFLGPAVLHAAMLSVTLMTVGHLPWQDWLTPQADGLFHSSAARGWGVVTPGGLVIRIAVNALIGLVVVSALAVFEEIGWRAWLLPRLADRLGARRAIVLTAIVWALWHVPFQLSGVQHVDGISPARLALVVPLGTFAAGLILGWLWTRTESIWIVALGHGALNNWGQYAFKYMTDFTSPDPSALLVAGDLALLIVGSLLLAFGLSSKAQSPIGLGCR